MAIECTCKVKGKTKLEIWDPETKNEEKANARIKKVFGQDPAC